MSTNVLGSPAPPLVASEWLGTKQPIELESLRGSVVVIHAFQMLCPGCVSHGIPQAKRIASTFDSKDVVVLGLHSVFEHHDAMKPVSLRAFVHEYRIEFPVAIDASSEQAVPQTMKSYQLRGTPSTILIDTSGIVRAVHFGRIEDMMIGAAIAGLIADQTVDSRAPGKVTESPNQGCRIA